MQRNIGVDWFHIARGLAVKNLKTRLQYLEWGFWLGGAAFVLLGVLAIFMVSQDDPVSAEYEWIPIACAALAGVGLMVCVGSRATEGMIVEGALRDAYAQYQKSASNEIPNDGQLAMLAGLPESRTWQAREFLTKRK
ncbi:MAG: hypothetical protein EYC68_19555 [Chloroflexota bacterium]|nr:MAG: hypothetical protein EYC68_19555 [Chloroflexota bacterium]